MDIYGTSDLGVASTLSCLGYPIISLDRSDPRRVTFRFLSNEKGLEEAVRGYWEGSLRLPPSALFTHQKLLKKRLYDERP